MFLALQDQCGDEGDACIQRLQWVIHEIVTTDVTVAAAKQIMFGDPEIASPTYPQWPGTAYPTTDDAGAALVGCPNGYGVAYMLGQHEAQFGGRYIDAAVIFRNDVEALSIGWRIAAL